MDDVAERLKSAFKKEEYRKELQTIRIAIENLLQEFMKELQNSLEDSQKIFRNVESRVKSIESFDEKIYRKDYVRTWEIPEGEKEVQAYIARNLPDLIGFRITCFFWKDEKVILNYMKRYYDENNFGPDIIINFDENQMQANGHEINKVTGLYKNKYCFELQIKSILHNIWGEVEHRTQYKSSTYDPSAQAKKEITEELFNILGAADRQLITLYNETLSKQKLVNALFFQYTKEEVAGKASTDILGKHYNNFFALFSDSITNEAINEYVANKLLSRPYQKREYQVGDSLEAHNLKNLVEQVQEKFIEFDIKCIYQIFGVLFNIDGYDTFLGQLVRMIDKKINVKFDDDIGYEDDFIDGLDDQSDELESNQQIILTELERFFRVRK